MESPLNAIVRVFMRKFFPGIAKSLEQEGQFDFREKGSAEHRAALPSCIEIEDNGSDVTVICFAGMAVLYAAMPKFEFRKTLLESGAKYNFLWVRDVHRSFYSRTPEGAPGGYEAYARIISEALAALKSTFHVAVGASGGGAAAFAFSRTLPIDQVIAFNPAFPMGVYCSGRSIGRAIFDIRKLFVEPRDYFEVMLVTIGARYLWSHCCRVLGAGNMPDSLEHYIGGRPNLRATLFYSDHARPDAEQILPLRDIPWITLKAVDSGRHNCMGQLKQRGEFGKVIQQEIQAALSARDANP